MSALQAVISFVRPRRPISPLCLHRVDGMAMYPEFRQGDAVLYRSDLDRFQYDACYVVNHAGGSAVYRAQAVGGGMIQMMLDKYPGSPQRVTSDVFNDICLGLIVGKLNVLDDRYIDLWGTGARQ